MPTVETIFLTFAGISFREIDSNISTNICHPSKPGKGKRLIIAKLMEIRPQSWRNDTKPKFCNVDVVTKPTAIIPPTD